MTPNDRHHWEEIWSSSDPFKVTWFQESPEVSLRLIDKCRLGRDARILDIGCGASTLVDGLLDRGYKKLFVLDLSSSALDHAKARLGDRSERVEWMNGDVTTFQTGEPFDLWHDRAVLHFLIRQSDRQRYARRLSASLATNGHAIIATFAIDGPEKCSGLEVRRYGAEDINALLGERFELREVVNETHLSPNDVEQRFTYFHLQRRP